MVTLSAVEKGDVKNAVDLARHLRQLRPTRRDMQFKDIAISPEEKHATLLHPFVYLRFFSMEISPV